MTPALAQPSSSPQFSAVRQFYDAVAAWNFDDLDKLFSEDYVHTTHPASAKDAPKNKAQGIEHAKAVGAMFGHAPLKVRQGGGTLAGGRSDPMFFIIIDAVV